MAKERDSNKGVASNRSVSRAVDILRALAASVEPLTVTEIAKRIDLPRATTFRIITTLEDEGIVDRQETLYRLGWDLTRIAQASDPAIGLSSRVGTLLQKLADQLQHTVTLSVRYGVYDLQMVLQYTPQHSGYSISQVHGTRWPLYAACTGKLLLADFSEQEVAALTDNQMEPITEHTITDSAALREELEIVRERGWGLNLEETESGIFSIAVPLRDRVGSLFAALAVVGPKHRLGPDPEPELQRMAGVMLEESAAIRQRLVSLPV